MSDFIARERRYLKTRWIYLLVLITCCMIAVVVAQQGETIDQQRTLIKVLWGDSKELTTLKLDDLRARHNQVKPAPNQAPAPAPQAPAKPKAQKPRPPQQTPERQAIEKPGPRLMRYI